MIHFLEHKSIDKKKWDTCIQRSANGMVYATSWYLDVVSPDWNALVAGDYEAVFPLTWRKKYGFHYLYQPSFTQQLGLFSVAEYSSEKTVQEFLSAIPERYRFVEINLNSKNVSTTDNYHTTNRHTHHLDLNEPLETIRNSYSENLKRNVKRASKFQVTASSHMKLSEIIKIFKNHKAKFIQPLKKKEYELLEQIIHEADQRSLVTLLGAETSTGKWCAGAVFLHSFHEYIFLFSAVNEVARKTGAMSMLIDHFISLHANENRLLDFEGSMDKKLARYYQSFGSKEIVYLQIRKNNLPSYVRWFKR